MVYQTVSSQSIIAKVFRDLKPSATNWLDDAIEWLGEVVEGIGVYNTLEHKTITLKVVDYKAQLPCNLESISDISFSDNKRMFLPIPVSNRTSNEVLFSGELWRAEVADCIKYHQPYCYYNPGVIVTSFETGYIKLDYNCFPLDEDNYPLIPDNYYYKQAAFWYIVSRLALRGDVKISFDKADSEWQTYQRLAANDCAFPSPERMDRFRERWARLVPPTSYQKSYLPEILPDM